MRPCPPLTVADTDSDPARKRRHRRSETTSTITRWDSMPSVGCGGSIQLGLHRCSDGVDQHERAEHPASSLRTTASSSAGRLQQHRLVVKCTTCHNQHLMNVVSVTNGPNSGLPTGNYATMFFIRGRTTRPAEPREQPDGAILPSVPRWRGERVEWLLRDSDHLLILYALGRDEISLPIFLQKQDEDNEVQTLNLRACSLWYSQQPTAQVASHAAYSFHAGASQVRRSVHATRSRRQTDRAREWLGADRRRPGSGGVLDFSLRRQHGGKVPKDLEPRSATAP